MPKITKEKVLEQFKSVHGNKYDYSLFEYINGKTKCDIICSIHGIFKQSPDLHKRGSGCPICKENYHHSKEKVIEDFKKIHGDRYDYSKVSYKSTHKKVIIICKEHGEFHQTPYGHKKGYGCSKCKNNKISKLKTLTQDDILKEFKKIHGDRYDYSKLLYKGSNKKVIIICKKHGEFHQTPSMHKKGHGCRLCRNNILNENEFLNKFNKIHNKKYDYSKTKIKNSHSKITIICPIHGEFEQSVSTHIRGYGCPYCSQKKIHKNDLIKEFKKTHGDRYDYSLVDYTNLKENVKIICKIHGEFEQSPSNHRAGSNCPKCANLKQSENNLLSQEDVIKDFKKIHGNRYDYSLVDYKNSKEDVKIICKIHGEFLQKPSSHKQGCGCLQCANEDKIERQRLTNTEILNSFKNIHGDRYDYSLVDYKGGINKIKIICPEHGIFEQSPDSHKSGSGCPHCFKGGFKKSLSGILYYIKIEINGRIVYKIGITNHSVSKRFGPDIKYITIIQEWYYEDGEECYEQEQRVLKDFEYAKWKGEDLLRSGNSEMFDRDVLLLDI